MDIYVLMDFILSFFSFCTLKHSSLQPSSCTKVSFVYASHVSIFYDFIFIFSGVFHFYMIVGVSKIQQNVLNGCEQYLNLYPYIFENLEGEHSNLDCQFSFGMDSITWKVLLFKI